MLDDEQIQKAIDAVVFSNHVPVAVAVSWEDYQDLVAVHGQIPGMELSFQGVPVGWQEQVCLGEVFCYGRPFVYPETMNVVISGE